MTHSNSIKQQLEAATSVIEVQGLTDTARLDAEVLLAHVLGCDRSYFMTWPEKSLSETVSAQFQQLVTARCEGQPIAYLIGLQEFWSLPLMVNKHTLIPRPDTECLIEYILAATQKSAACADFYVLDAGTGTGAIALALRKERPDWHIMATDISYETLSVAAHNQCALALPIDLICMDWLAALADDSFDLILSNPPYIREGDLHLQALTFEPIDALVAEGDGLACLKILAREGQRVLKPGGRLMLEHGFDQGMAVRTLLADADYQNIETIRDYAGLERHTLGFKAG